MNVAEALASELLAAGGITALSSQRIYPMTVSQTMKMPFILYQQISNVPVHAFIGDPKIRMYRFQLSIRSTSYSATVALSTQIKNTLRDKTGTLGTSNFTVQRIFFDGEYDLPESDPQTRDFIFHRAQDYLIWTTG